MKYLAKKIITLIMTLFLVSVLAFLAFQIIPGDVVTSILGTEATPEREEALRAQLGLDQPPLVRYMRWAGNLLKGDFGESYRYSKNMNQMMPVKELIGDKLPVTLLLALLSMILIAVIAIPLGVFWARPHPIDKKFEAFGFETITIDGHDFDEIEAALIKAQALDKPVAIIAKTVKGKGVSYMENAVNWHGAAPNDELFEQAMAELKDAYAKMN